MATVVANMSMSLDGFSADPSDDVGPLFDWFRDGPVAVPSADLRWTYHTSEASARHLRDSFTRIGALVRGRRLFDFAKGWGGNHPLGVPVFVVTYMVPDGWPRNDAPFTFVTDGIDSALAQAKSVAGEKMVAIATPNITQQCLNAGLLDEVLIDLVPCPAWQRHSVLQQRGGCPHRTGRPHRHRGRRRRPPGLPRSQVRSRTRELPEVMKSAPA